MSGGDPVRTLRYWIERTDGSGVSSSVDVDDEGRFSIQQIPTDTTTVTLTPVGYAPYVIETPALKAGEPFQVTFSPDVGGTATGVVVDHDGRPVAGALVGFGPFASASADAEGRFKVAGIPTDVMVALKSAQWGYEDGSAEPMRFSSGSKKTGVRITLKRIGSRVD